MSSGEGKPLWSPTGARTGVSYLNDIALPSRPCCRLVRSRSGAVMGAALGVLAVLMLCLCGPAFFVVGLPPAVAALVLGSQRLGLRRSVAGFAASGPGLVALLIPPLQFVFQS